MCTKVGHLREKMTNVNNEATLEIFPKDEKVFFFFWGGGSSPHLDESGPTRFALVWLFSRVDTSMSLEIGWPVKLSSADVAVVWLCTWRLRKAGEYNNSLP